MSPKISLSVFVNRSEAPRILEESAMVIDRWLQKNADGRNTEIVITDCKSTACIAATSGLKETIILIGDKYDIDSRLFPKILVCLPCDFVSVLRDALWDTSESE